MVPIKLIKMPAQAGVAHPRDVPRADSVMALAVINPYQATTDSETSFADEDPLRARYELTRGMNRFAESKYMLTRRGGRLTFASLVIVALAVVACFPLAANGRDSDLCAPTLRDGISDGGLHGADLADQTGHSRSSRAAWVCEWSARRSCRDDRPSFLGGRRPWVHHAARRHGLYVDRPRGADDP